jgi:hypothetical protein
MQLYPILENTDIGLFYLEGRYEGRSEKGGKL